MIRSNDGVCFVHQERKSRRNIKTPVKIYPRLVRSNVRPDLFYARQILGGQFQHNLGGEVQPHEPVSPIPINSDFDYIAHIEGMVGWQSINNVGSVFARKDHWLIANCPGIAFLRPGKGVKDRFSQVTSSSCTLTTRVSSSVRYGLSQKNLRVIVCGEIQQRH